MKRTETILPDGVNVSPGCQHFGRDSNITTPDRDVKRGVTQSADRKNGDWSQVAETWLIRHFP